jgi:hypothetical protein
LDLRTAIPAVGVLTLLSAGCPIVDQLRNRGAEQTIVEDPETPDPRARDRKLSDLLGCRDALFDTLETSWERRRPRG